MPDWREELDRAVDAMAEDLRRTRRHLHSHPEPSREEFRTADFLARRLDAAGIPCSLIASRRGVIAGPGETAAGSRIAFRADVDALRIQDRKDVAYRSGTEGVMHACGHDAHATMALGAAIALWECREGMPWPVPWRAVFQPAEEVGEGAVEMVESGALEGVAAIIALHVDPEMPVGGVSYRVGVMTAFCQELAVTIRGQGGHAARPHQSIDPIAIAAQFVNTVYQFLPRSIDAREAAVVTFGVIQGGASANVIPDHVELRGTIRTLSWSSASKVEQRLRQIARGLAEAGGGSIEIHVEQGVDAVVNDPAITGTCVRAASEVVGGSHVFPIPLPSMGGEDFSGYLAHTPGCLLRIGVATENEPRHFLHSPFFDINENALTIGAKVLAHSVVLLSEQGARK